ncbi:MAG: aspartate aminotransferase family protein [Desulfobacteraceae bacterium]|nr:aspartate aminotransferase family protein [Desulfobacteraceae bacterium]
MISEQALAKLSYPEAPRMVTDKVPGPKAQKLLEDVIQVESMARGGGRFPLVFDEGMGSTVKDPDGNIYIDISAGVAVNSVGRRHPRVVEAMQKQLGKLMHASDISNTNRTLLAKKISQVMPEGLRGNCATYFTQSGSGAVETAIKFVRKITGRTQIVAFHGAYHGVWCGSNSLTTGDQYRRGYGPFIPGVIHVPYPYSYRCPFNSRDQETCEELCANYIDYLLNTPYTAADEVGAVIVEPLQGEGGYISPSGNFFVRLKEACEKHGALFIADEIQAGAGRTGKMWSIEHSGVQPDMVTWGKGMGGDLPMGGLSLRKDLAENIEDGSQPNTFAGNALSAAVCMTNIDILTENDMALVLRTAEVGEETLKEIQKGAQSTRLIGDVRGRGLMIGIELVKDKETREPVDGDIMRAIIMGMLKRGIVMVPCGRNGNVLRFMPSLTITREYLNKATGILLETIREVE